MGASALSPCPALAQSSEKMDEELRKVLEVANPSDPVAIIVVLRERPTEEQLNTLKTVNKMEISYVYKIIDGVAGRAPAGEIPKIAEYDWVKEVWLDKKVYVTVGISKLIKDLQEESEGLRRNVSELQELISAQQSRIHGLEAELGAYLAAMFMAGLVIGVGATALIKRSRLPPRGRVPKVRNNARCTSPSE